MRLFAQKRPVNDDVHDGEFCLHYVQIRHRNKPYDVWKGPYIEKDFIDVFFSVPQSVMDGLLIVLYSIRRRDDKFPDYKIFRIPEWTSSHAYTLLRALDADFDVFR